MKNAQLPIASAAVGSAPTVSLGAALRFWLKLGFISFGGPAGQIAIMHKELVEQRRWISDRRFLHALNYCMLLPGPEAQQLATYLGWLLHRTWGGVFAGLLFILPSLFILIGLAWVYLLFADTLLVSGIFYGIKPAVTAIIVLAAERLARRTLHNRALWFLAVAAFIATALVHIPFPFIVLSAALAGWCGARYRPLLFQAATKAEVSPTHAVALINDQSEIPAHAVFRWQRLVTVLISGALLWLLPVLLLGLTFGWHHGLVQMAWFFTTAALLTFGGAYAVLPYVYQGAVEHYSWVTPTQMMDGLALGETTPGPLIMVVVFVGFLGGYQQLFFATTAPFVAGAVAAITVCWFTFLPSFIFILAGAPLIESSHKNLHLSGPLTAITAAVIGVIFTLALFFARHTLWPSGLIGEPDIAALVIGVISAVALFWFRWGIIPIIIFGAGAGLVFHGLAPAFGR